MNRESRERDEKGFCPLYPQTFGFVHLFPCAPGRRSEGASRYGRSPVFRVLSGQGHPVSCGRVLSIPQNAQKERKDAEELWLKFFEEKACKTARERVQCQTVSAGNKIPGDTIFCGQTGYNPVKLPIFCVCPLDKTTRWDYHRPCTDQGNDDEIGKSESRENLDSDDGTFSQAYLSERPNL